LVYVDITIAVLTQNVSGQQCLQSASVSGIPFEDLGPGRASERLPTERQVIITSYQFRCCGNITRWQTYVEPGEDTEDGMYSISFQVWRPFSGAQDGRCYYTTGEDNYDQIDLGANGLVDRTLEPANYLTVQPGDVVGYFMIREEMTDVMDGIQLDSRIDNDDGGEEVWYSDDSIPELNNECLFSVGSGPGRTLRLFTNSAPVLSVDVGKIEPFFHAGSPCIMHSFSTQMYMQQSSNAR
jgi:hypothetical protein